MEIAIREKLSTVNEAVRFRPRLGIAIVLISLGTALLEGVGLGFLLPIIEITQSSTPPGEADGLLGRFVQAYAFLGLPFTLEFLMIGIAVVMSLRFGLTFLTGWLQAILARTYQRHLRRELFDSLVYGPIEYLDQQGSDDLLNTLVTETKQSAGVAMSAFNIVEVLLRGSIYLVIAVTLSPALTLVALVSLGISTLAVRYVLEPAYTTGEDIADANERFQTVAQTSIQGMRDVRLFNLRPTFVERIEEVLGAYVTNGVRLERNKAALNSLNQFTNAMVVFGLVYVGFRFTPLSFGELAVFLFAVFRLSPVINKINTATYHLDGRLPHLVRVQSRIRELEEMDVPDGEGQDSIDSVRRVTFDDVTFAYGDERVLNNVSFDVERGEKVALVGPSGAGKSTIVSLLGRLQSPDSGRILADGTSIDEFDVGEWRERLAVVRQAPFLFDDTLIENVRVGNRDATRQEVEQVCKIAQVTEFLSELPDGYDTELGEDGVRLSGGQKQRVAIARALLKDADVLVLDEATSELDSNIERDVYEGIRRREGRYATISIAHDLSTIEDADRIYTIVDGSVTEDGTHEQLLSDDGTYADLYATQA